MDASAPGLIKNVEKQETLERVLASPELATSSRARDFLRYIVEEDLAGRADRIKGYNIATVALGKSGGFNSDSQSAVRVLARRVRAHLRAYYEGAGANDDLIIAIPLGSYAPIFARKTAGVAQLREKLRQSEQALSALTDNLPDNAVFQFIVDKDGAPHFVFISAGVEKLNGVTVNEVLEDAQALLGQIPREYLVKLFEAMQACLREGRDFLMDVPMDRRDGERRWMRLRSRPIPGSDGITVWHGVQTDVTELKRADEALRESDERSRLLIESTAQAVWEANADGQAVVDSPSWRAYTGQSVEESMGYGWVEAIHPDDRETAFLGWREAVATRKLDAEYRIRGADGVYRWSNVRAAPLLDDEGSIRKWVGMNIDIDARTRAGQAVRESEERLRFALRAAKAAAWEWNAQTNKSVWSDGIWPLYGLPAKSCEPSFESWRQIVHPDDREEAVGIVREAVLANSEFAFEWRTLDGPDGERWLMSRGAPLHDDAGAISRYAGIVIDVTERKRAEQRALEARAELEAALGAMTDSVFICDAQGRIVHFNDAFPAYCRCGGGADDVYEAEFATKFQVLTLDGAIIPPPERPMARALRGETATGVEMRVRRTDTGEEWLGNHSYAPIRDGAGAVVGAVVTARDITAQRRIEARLREHERRLAAIVDAALDGIIAIDEKGIVLSANPAALDMFGYTSDELLGANISMTVPEARHAADFATQEAALAGQRRVVAGLRKNGELFPKEVTVTEAQVDGQRLIIGIMRDLSAVEAEKRRVETLRAELTRVGRLNEMSEIVSGLAHELGQPLAALQAYLATSRRLRPPDTPDGAPLQKAQEQATRAAEILARLRRFIDRRRPQRRAENLRELIENALLLCEPAPNDRPCRIIRRFMADDICVLADRVQIEQVIVNLLRNAQDAATVDGVNITLSTAIDREGFVRISIADDGSGLDSKLIETLFEPFVSPKISGLGLGLSICRSIVEQHGGRIGFVENPPRGAMFFFTVPVVAT